MWDYYFFACRDLLGLQGDYFIFLNPCAKSAFIFSIRQFLVRHSISSILTTSQRINFYFVTISKTCDLCASITILATSVRPSQFYMLQFGCFLLFFYIFICIEQTGFKFPSRPACSLSLRI